jgi:hypothetical protein
VFGKEDASKLAVSAGLWKKLGNTTLEILNVPRALQSSFDLSAPFRQGLVLGARHPKMFASEFKPMLKAYKSETAYKDVMDEIASRPTFQTMRDSKLALTDLENISNREEAFASNLAEYVPGVRASGRAYVAFLNKFRADAFDNYLKLAESQGRDITDPHLLDSIARWVNYATGRGGQSKFVSSHAVALNATFFSPRLIASRVNLLFNPVYYKQLDPFARKQALQGMAQLIGGISLTLYMAKLAGANVGLDPRSANFGKIRVGNTRIDVMGGFQQYIVAASRLIKGESVSSTNGAVEHLTGGFGKSSRGTLLSRLAQQKFAPIPGFAWGALNNENFAGLPFNIPKEAAKLLLPLGPQNAYDTYRQQGGQQKRKGQDRPATVAARAVAPHTGSAGPLAPLMGGARDEATLGRWLHRLAPDRRPSRPRPARQLVQPQRRASPMSEMTDYDRGLREGRVDALLEEHTLRLNKINGSVERHAKSNETLAKEMKSGFDKLAAEMRTMQEEARARELAVQVAADTLAKETERRREELASAGESSRWRFTRGQQIFAAFVSVAALLVTVYLSTH